MPASTGTTTSLEAILSILDGAHDFKTIEQKCFALGMALAAKIFENVLMCLDEELARTRPRTLRNKGSSERTIQTVFGEVTIKRRRYREEIREDGKLKKGRYRYLLDETLGLPQEERISPGLTEALVEGAVEEPFRQVVERRQEAGLPTPSHTTVHNLTRKLGEMVSREQEEQRRAVFEYAQELPGEKKEVACLFLEADGTMVHLQREEQKLSEVKIGISYEGWERRSPGSKEYTLVNPMVNCGVFSDSDAFWETTAARLSRRYDLDHSTYMVLSSDGAGWIDGARDYFDGIQKQLDRFHLYRSIRSAFGPEESSRLIGLLGRGDVRAFMDTMEASIGDGKTREERVKRRAVFNFCKGHEGELVDYRLREEQPPPGIVLRGMGAIEPYVDKVIANRMKKRGMRWTLAGADAMARLRALDANGELHAYASRRITWQVRTDAKVVARVKERVLEDPGGWLRKAVPALYGPHRNRPWVRAIRELLSGKEAMV
ncbi:MAG TPA: ISLre2 family transposase [Firmicutes bacterium]|nr:ISLre2 family transposase [Bacillota bacterium]